MIKQNKIDEVKNLVNKLQARKNLFFTNYSGTKVKDLSELRRGLRQKNAEFKVVKNTLFKRALKEAGYEGLDDYLKGPLGVAFVNEEIGEVAKVLKEFSKDREKFVIAAGVLENVVYNEEQIKKIADLPSKEVLLSQIMSLINGPATHVASGMNQIMASLARGINAVAEAQNK